ncbi:MAG: hypothetical protein ACRC1P_09950 [Cellulosilyticaceae bacterium]
MGQIGFIGIGEGGGNICRKLHDVGFKNVFYINSAMKDLKKIDATAENSYHIPAALGCARNRDLAKQYVKENYDIILSHVQQKMSNLKIVYLVFSMAGGTGSGMSPILLSGLIKRMPHIKFGTMSIIPNRISSPKMKYNACECYSELCDVISKNEDAYDFASSFFINNDNICEENVITSSLDLVDNAFISRFHDLCMVEDSKGSVDSAEILTVLSVPGNALVYEIVKETKTEKRLILDISMSPSKKKKSKMMLYSIKDDSNFMKAEIEDIVGVADDNFVAYNEYSEFIASFGMKFPDYIFTKLRSECEDTMIAKSLDEEEEDDESFTIGTLKSTFNAKPVTKDVKEKAKKNTDDLWDDLADF